MFTKHCEHLKINWRFGKNKVHFETNLSTTKCWSEGTADYMSWKLFLQPTSRSLFSCTTGEPESDKLELIWRIWTPARKPTILLPQNRRDMDKWGKVQRLLPAYYSALLYTEWETENKPLKKKNEVSGYQILHKSIILVGLWQHYTHYVILQFVSYMQNQNEYIYFNRDKIKCWT